jgi:hypothetical protein
MPRAREIDFELLIERSIKHFEPVKPLWPIGLRFALWLLLEATILTLSSQFMALGTVPDLIQNPSRLIGVGALILAGTGASFLGLRSAIPGREAMPFELLLLAGVLSLAFIVGFGPPVWASLSDVGSSAIFEIFGLMFLPWVALFCAARRGICLRSMETGGLVGIASFSFALAGFRFMSPLTGLLGSTIWQLSFGLVVTGVSAVAGALWLDPTHLWRRGAYPLEARTANWVTWCRAAVLPLAVCASSAALLLALETAKNSFAPIPDFDLAVEGYQRSVSGFQPNVPSTSIETVLTAYVEHGMPAYMWDFTGQGFKLEGGRFERLPDGSAVTYTWFRGTEGGLMCMFRQTERFSPPSAAHQEHQRILFYTYRGFSVCLINVGGYGRFISVIAARLPMNQFVPLVLAAAL